MKRFYFVCLLCFDILLLASLAASFMVDHKTNGASDSVENIISGWETADGSAVLLDDLKLKDDRSFDITCRVPASTDQGTDLSLISTNINFEVFVNDTSVYSYFPTLEKIYGSTYGNDVHIISLGSVNADTVLRIRGTGLDGSMFMGFRRAYIGSGNSFIRQLIREELWKFPIS